MNKKDLTVKVWTELGEKVPQELIGDIITKSLAAIVAEVAAGGSVTLLGFGTLTSKPQASRNIGTLIGGVNVIPAHRKVHFKPVDAFRKAVW